MKPGRNTEHCLEPNLNTNTEVRTQKRERRASYKGGVAVFRAGLKNGVWTTVAPT